MTDTVRDSLLCAIGHALLLVIKRLDEGAVFGSAYIELKEILKSSEQEPDNDMSNKSLSVDEKLEIARKALQEIADTTFAVAEEDGYEATIDNMCDVASKALVKLDKPLETLNKENTK